MNDDLDPAGWDATYDRPSGRIFVETIERINGIFGSVRRDGDVWVDVGCGTGRAMRRMMVEPCRVIGLDTSHAMLDFALEAGGGVPEPGRREFLRASALSLPLATSSVHGIVAASLMGRLPDPEPFLAETARVLVPGGHAVLSCTSGRSFCRAMDRLLALFGGRVAPSHTPPPSIRTYLPRQMVAFARRAGLRPVAVHEYGFFAQSGSRAVSLPGFLKGALGITATGSPLTLGRNFVLVARAPL